MPVRLQIALSSRACASSAPPATVASLMRTRLVLPTMLATAEPSPAKSPLATPTPTEAAMIVVLSLASRSTRPVPASRRALSIDTSWVLATLLPMNDRPMLFLPACTRPATEMIEVPDGTAELLLANSSLPLKSKPEPLRTPPATRASSSATGALARADTAMSPSTSMSAPRSTTARVVLPMSFQMNAPARPLACEPPPPIAAAEPIRVESIARSASASISSMRAPWIAAVVALLVSA